MAKLKRALGLWEATLTGVGVILGAGIYALIGEATGLAGNSTWLAFIIASIVAGLTGLSYAELSSMLPKAGAEYVYTKKAFGDLTSFTVGWLLIVSAVVSSATVALGFGGYFTSVFPEVPFLAAGIGMSIVFTLVAMWGIRESAWIAVLFTLIEAGGLVLIIAIGLPYLGSVDYLEAPLGFGGLFAASALVFFAYIGFEDVARLSEEVRNPGKNIPRALILALIISVVLYALTSVSVVSVMGWDALAASKAPLAEVAATALGSEAFLLLSAIAIFSTSNTVLLMVIGGARVLYGMGEGGSLPSFFGGVWKSRKTPAVATACVGALVALFVLVGDIGKVANLTNFTLFLTFILVNAAVIKLRFKLPRAKRPFKLPLNIGRVPVLPLLGIITCVFLLANIEPEVAVYGVLLLVLGIAVYYVMKAVRVKKKSRKA